MEIAFLLYPGMTALDFVGPHEVLCRLPGVVIRRVSKQPGPVKTDSEVQLIAEYGVGDATRPDVLVVPGAASATDMRDEPEILDWVRNAHAGTTWTTSVCTGSLIVGAAGVLSGLKATTHWAALDRLLIYGAEPTQSRVVEAGKVITASGERKSLPEEIDQQLTFLRLGEPLMGLACGFGQHG